MKEYIKISWCNFWQKLKLGTITFISIIFAAIFTFQMHSMVVSREYKLVKTVIEKHWNFGEIQSIESPKKYTNENVAEYSSVIKKLGENALNIIINF